MVGTTAICLDAWLHLVGLPLSSFYKIRQMVLSVYAFNTYLSCLMCMLKRQIKQMRWTDIRIYISTLN